jgi:radical SAM superfamily enzyme YgiQ (UPF0313 family)
MRDIINKNVMDEDLLSAAEAAFRCGWKRIKLYFMIGLPGETDEDIVGIARLASEVAKVGRKLGVRPTVTLSVSCFVPKPHTPFQWRAQDTVEELERKQDVLKQSLRRKEATLHWHDARTSRLEAVLSRGDRRLAKAIYLAWRKGCRFDAWDEHLDYGKWIESLSESGLDPAFYANRRREHDETLPWDHISSGVGKRFLMREDERAESGEVTPDCRAGKCIGCGMAKMMDGVADVACAAEAS